eukprot:scaffold502052_cov43-Prasinocladus_malaysianus.AAC.1
MRAIGDNVWPVVFILAAIKNRIHNCIGVSDLANVSEVGVQFELSPVVLRVLVRVHGVARSSR